MGDVQWGHLMTHVFPSLLPLVVMMMMMTMTMANTGKDAGYPLVNIQKAIENGHRNSGFSH